MKNRDIIYAKQSVKIYSNHYRPTTNVWQFMRSIIGACLYGSSTPTDYTAPRRGK